MREIKFRAWDAEAGKMIYTPNETPPDATKETDCYYIGWTSMTGTWQMYCESNGRIREIDNLMQYTGEKDIDGREIYEGDIVKTCGGNKYGELAKVHFLSAEFELRFLKDHSGDSIANYSLKIVGNIYENPELLKGAGV